MTDNVIWVKTEPSVDGKTYVVTVEFSQDRALVLNHDGAARYASAVLSAAQRAEYDAAVFAQLKSVDVDQRAIAEVILGMREDRPPLDDAATVPLRLEPGVNQAGEGFLALHLDGHHVGQWSPTDARQHALHALDAVHAADLDAGFYRHLRSTVRVPGPTARNMIDDLRNWREGGL